MTERSEMEAVIEAILFVAKDPVSSDRLLDVFASSERDEARLALAAVVERYQRDEVGQGVTIDEVAGGLRLVTRPDLHGYLRRFFEAQGSHKLTMAALETLAIVAYRQPVTAPEIQELRGVGSSGVLKTLLERRLVRITGRKEVVGKPFLYATTREFLLHFGLRSLKELPPLEQFEEVFGGDGTGDELVGSDFEEEVEQQVIEVREQEEAAAERSDETEDRPPTRGGTAGAEEAEPVSAEAEVEESVPATEENDPAEPAEAEASEAAVEEAVLVEVS